MLGHATTNHSAVEDIQGREQGGGAVPLVVVGHGGAFARLQRQAGLGAVYPSGEGHLPRARVI